MRLAYLLLLAAAACLAQTADLDSNTLTVTAVRATNLPNDEVTVAVLVTAQVGMMVDEVLGLLAGTGITASDLSQAEPPPAGSPANTAQWYFTPTVPLAKSRALFTALDRIQSDLYRDGSTNSVIFDVAGVQPSAATQAAHPCNNTTLLTDARTMAQSLAAAAVLRVGTVLSITQPPTSAAYPGVFMQWVQPGNLGSQNPAAYLVPSPASGNLPGTCSITVQFQLTR
jgi:hypothetical protein